MTKITVFSIVVAEVAQELSLLFPSEFDFKEMLTTICEDSGVCIQIHLDKNGVCYKLQGLWSAMEAARKLLTAAVRRHGVQPVTERTSALVLASHSEDTPEHRPQLMQSTTLADNKHQLRLTPLKLLSDAKSCESDETPCSGHTVSLPSHTHSSDHAAMELRYVKPHTDNPSVQKPSKYMDSAGSKCRQMISWQKSKRLSCRKKQTANDFSCKTSGLCRGENHECADNDIRMDLNLATTNKQHNAEIEEVAFKKEENAKRSILKTSLAVGGNEIHMHCKRTQKKRSRKSVPRQLSVVTHRYTFLSKYKDRNHCLPHTSVHKSRAIAPVSLDASNLAVKMKQRLSHKYEDNCAKLSCSECKFVTLSRSKLMGHIHRQHKGSPVRCDLCGNIFYSRANMLRHRSSHTGPQHCCDICGKMFKIEKAMLKHRKTHEEGYTKPAHPCKLCEKTFCSQYIVDCHVRSFHMGHRKSYLCSVCGKKFTTKHSLQEHANAHAGTKPHICEVCGKGFSYDSALRDHKFTHVDEKQFSCDVCSKRFCQRSGLKMHMRIHKDVKQFQCQECGRDFTQKQALQRHERVHKGVKPFTCRLCSRSFSDASIIRRHLMLVHKIHKDAKTWREDIICTVQPDLDYHVSFVGVQEPDPQPAKAAFRNISPTETRGIIPARAQTGKKRTKKTLSQKGTNAVNVGSHVSVQSVSESNHGMLEGDFLSIPASYNSDQFSLCGKIYPQDSTTSQHIDKSVSHPLKDLPQVPDSANIHLQSHHPSVSLVSAAVSHTPSHSSSMTAQSASDQRCSFSAVCYGTLEESASLPTTDKGSAVQTMAHKSSFMQSTTVEENTSAPLHSHGPQTPCPCLSSREGCNTMAGAPGTTTTITPAGYSPPIAATQSWPSLYYYTQLASQFGMALSDYPSSYVAGNGTLAGGVGLAPSSPGPEPPTPSGYHRPQQAASSLGADHSASPLLACLQGRGLSGTDLLLRHGCREARHVFAADGQDLGQSSAGVESSARSDVSLDGGDEHALGVNVRRESGSVQLGLGGGAKNAGFQCE